jgi:tRNA threonylcarbamoyladenosine biosynthesis protein TsaB
MGKAGEGSNAARMLILALDGSLACCSAALCDGGAVLAHRALAGARIQPSALPPMAEAVLAAGRPDAVAVVVGPGSFTGLRAAIALAEGIALGLGVTLVGVTTGEALAAALPSALREGHEVWAAVDTQRGRVALERFAPGAAVPLGPPEVFEERALPRPSRMVAVAGDAAPLVAARLLARDQAALLTDSRLPDAVAVARVAALRLAGAIPPRDAAPLYQEPPALRATP